MWGMSLLSNRKQHGFFKETDSVKALDESAPEGLYIIGSYWGSVGDHVTTMVISPRSKKWKLNNGVKCQYELTRGKICTVDTKGNIKVRQALDGLLPFTHPQKLTEISDFIKKTL